MQLDELQAEISLLLTQMEDQPENRRELYVQIHHKLNELRAMGLPLPGDLARVERELENDFCAESQGR